MAAQEKDVKIKTGVLKRILKEKIMYENEHSDLESKIQQYKAENKDQRFIKKQEEILKEDAMMVTDALKRLTTAYNNLKDSIPSHVSEDNAVVYEAAKKLLEEAAPHLSTDTA